MLSLLRRWLIREPSTPLVWLPETDLDSINKGVCPDCGENKWEGKGLTSTVECNACGSAFVVVPINPPYLSVNHMGFNRVKRARIKEK